MSEWRQFSRLPDSADYWQRLHQRVGRAAYPVLRARTRRDRWLDVALVSATLAAAAVAALLIVQTPAAPAASIQARLAPADPVAVELLNSREAPHISGLLPAYRP